MSEPADAGPLRLVLGVTPDQPDAVVEEAAAIAQRIGAELVLAVVDPATYVVDQDIEGRVVAWPLDPDAAEEVTERFDPELQRHLEAILRPTGIRYDFRALAGDPAQQLARLADELEAQAIVVGVRKRGLRAAAHEFLNGSVGVHLAHRQHRPVIVIPVDPVGFETKLPWEED